MSIIRWQRGPADPEGPVPLMAQAIPQSLVLVQGRRAYAFLDGLSDPSTTQSSYLSSIWKLDSLASVISYRLRRVGCGMWYTR